MKVINLRGTPAALSWNPFQSKQLLKLIVLVLSVCWMSNANDLHAQDRITSKVSSTHGSAYYSEQEFYTLKPGWTTWGDDNGEFIMHTATAAALGWVSGYNDGISIFARTQEMMRINDEVTVFGRIRSSSPNGGLWLDDRLEGFVGVTGDYYGFWTSGKGWDAFRIHKDSGFVGIGTSAPKRTLDLGDEGELTFGDNVATDSQNGIYWHAGSDYGIYRTPGTWTGNDYQQLKMRWSTGIILDPGSAYGKSYVDVQGGGLRVTSGKLEMLSPTTASSKIRFGGNTGSDSYHHISSGRDLIFNTSSTGNGLAFAFRKLTNGYNDIAQYSDLLTINADGAISAGGTITAAAFSVGSKTIDENYLDGLEDNATPWLVSGSDIGSPTQARVGIGTDSPTEKLDVLGGNVAVRPARLQGQAMIFLNYTPDHVAGRWKVGLPGGNHGKFAIDSENNGTSTPYLTILPNDGRTIFKSSVTASDYKTADGVSVINRINNLESSAWTNTSGNLIHASGNVGVGTTTPTEKLEVNGNVKASGALILNNTSLGESELATLLDLPNEAALSGNFGDRAVSTTANFFAHPKTPTAGSPAQSSSMTLSSAGLAPDGVTRYNNWRVQARQNGGWANSDLVISQNKDGYGFNERFKIDGTGKVGIGVAGPLAEQLEVNGNIKASAVKLGTRTVDENYLASLEGQSLWQENPEALKADVGVTIGNSNSTAAGTIRFNPSNNDFEGYNGTEWVSLTQNNQPERVAYVNATAIIEEMPGYATAIQTMTTYSEQLRAANDILVAELDALMLQANTVDTTRTSEEMSQLWASIEAKRLEIKNQIASDQEDYAARYEAEMAPLQQQVLTAIEAVALANGITHVLNHGASDRQLLVHSSKPDVLLDDLVRTHLGISTQ